MGRLSFALNCGSLNYSVNEFPICVPKSNKKFLVTRKVFFHATWRWGWRKGCVVIYIITKKIPKLSWSPELFWLIQQPQIGNSFRESFREPQFRANDNLSIPFAFFSFLICINISNNSIDIFRIITSFFHNINILLPIFIILFFINYLSLYIIFI